MDIYQSQEEWDKLNKSLSELFDLEYISIPYQQPDITILTQPLEPWNKGKIMDDEYRKSISDSKKGKPITKEHHDKIVQGRKLKGNTPEHNKKISQSNKNKIVSKETRQKLSLSHKGQIPWMKGKNHNDETKKRISETVKTINYGTKTCPVCGRQGKVPSIHRHIKKCQSILHPSNLLQ